MDSSFLRTFVTNWRNLYVISGGVVTLIKVNCTGSIGSSYASIKGKEGFKDLRAFSEALLAKQGWRILNRPHTLVARSLKAKYFPNTSFLKAKCSNNVSYTWRSIHKASWILKKGCYWLIGNGMHTKIWEDNWLPSQNGLKL